MGKNVEWCGKYAPMLSPPLWKSCPGPPSCQPSLSAPWASPEGSQLGKLHLSPEQALAPGALPFAEPASLPSSLQALSQFNPHNCLVR